MAKIVQQALQQFAPIGCARRDRTNMKLNVGRWSQGGESRQRESESQSIDDDNDDDYVR